MPGYQLGNSDKSKIDKKYFCSFCDLLLRDAMQTSCGHFYCFSCLGNLRDPVLPLVLVCLEDKQQLKENEVFADNFMRREVASIIVSCISTSEGCTWKGEVRHLEAHTVGCDFQKVKCVHPDCGILVETTSLAHHLKNECESRVVTCELCHSQVVFCELKMHVSHYHKNFYKALMSGVEEEIIELRRRFDDKEMEWNLKFDALIRRMRPMQNVTSADSREYPQAQQTLNYDGQLLWNITEFGRKRSEAVDGLNVSFYSPCFYTSRQGYKVCALIYLNGAGMGRGTHISLFFVVMCGEYDVLLRWPFRQKVTFILMDQDNVEHVIDCLRPDPDSPSFQRPQRETNIPSGCPTFFPIEELNNHAYVREDTMFLRIIVDTSDLQ